MTVVKEYIKRSKLRKEFVDVAGTFIVKFK